LLIGITWLLAVVVICLFLDEFGFFSWLKSLGKKKDKIKEDVFGFTTYGVDAPPLTLEMLKHSIEILNKQLEKTEPISAVCHYCKKEDFKSNLVVKFMLYENSLGVLNNWFHKNCHKNYLKDRGLKECECGSGVVKIKKEDK
jgi:hypothetical protein